MATAKQTRPGHGKAIRLARVHAGLSQAGLGRMIGYSASQISRFETGSTEADMDTLRLIARTLRIPPSDVGLSPDTPTGPEPAHINQGVVTLGTNTETKVGDEMPLERCGFLFGVTAAVGLGSLGSLLPASSAAAASDDQITALDGALFAPVDAVVGSERLLGNGLAAARANFHAGRYEALGRTLPPMVASAWSLVEASAGAGNHARASGILADVLSLASEWAVKQNQDALAWVCADRTTTAARSSNDPTSAGEAARQLAVAMRRAGHYDAATTLLVDGAGQLGAQSGNPSVIGLVENVGCGSG